MNMLILASVAFAAIHLLVAGTRLRDRLVAAVGEKVYSALFSLASAGLLGWMIWSFSRVRILEVTPLYDLRILAVLLMFFAVSAIVLGVTTNGPTGVGGGKKLGESPEPRGIHRVTRHPFLWGTALWALVHVIYNPGATGYVFFGAFLLIAVAGTFSIDAKRARRYPEQWPEYARNTSNIPFAAIASGRNRLVLSEIEWWKWLGVLAVFVSLLKLHARFFGLPAW